MEVQNVQNLLAAPSGQRLPQLVANSNAPSFADWLAQAGGGLPQTPGPGAPVQSGAAKTTTPLTPVATEPPMINAGHAATAYSRMQGPATSADVSDWAKYRDDQLLSNPGGDAYFVEGPESQKSSGPRSFWGRIGKDLADAADNLGNFFQNLLFGAEIHYRDPQGQVQSAHRRGVLGSLTDVVSDLGSALTFGAWRPDGEAAPQGLVERADFAFDKLKEALVGDLVSGVGGSVNQMGEDLLLAGWNLVEAIPDATVGNFATGEQLVSNIFDNGQVAIDYITDILPAGEAWLRVHSADLRDSQTPIFYNLQSPENFTGDTRWEQVRNTPLRKTIETIGALLADVATLQWLGQLPTSSEQRR